MGGCRIFGELDSDVAQLAEQRRILGAGCWFKSNLRLPAPSDTLVGEQTARRKIRQA